MIEKCFPVREGHFNCTIQELKRDYQRHLRVTAIDFNCTIQELKRVSVTEIYAQKRDFNCTIQELKPMRCRPVCLASEFQLHHTGIKTSAGVRRSKSAGHFNCTIQELKLRKKISRFILFFISIAPYRN